jgi:uncharacterized membrane-anchored protein
MTAQRRLGEVAAAVAEARRAVAEGAHIEVSGLDAAVEQICAGAQDVPAAERSAFMRELGELADALDQLAAEITRQSEAAQRRRATDAYDSGGA